MPHIVLKMLVGRSEQTKREIAAALTEVVMAGAGCEAAAVSVGIEDVAPGDWTEKIYKPEIAGKWDSLYKKPGYGPL